MPLRPLFALTSSILAAAAAVAQQAPTASVGTLDEIIVTAQKKAENLQAVPISIQAIDTRKLAQLQVASFDDYAKYLPSLSVQSYGPGQAQLYVRGVTNGGDGLRAGSQPLVGLYLDEMPVTTIGNNLDLHIYDVQRVEALSGPQGTLFGSSSMAGTLRIITNKPDATKFEAGYDITANTYTKGDPGGLVEGFINIPLNERAAIRLVGWSEHDGGYINTVVAPTQTYPTSGIARSNIGSAKKNYNTIDTAGGRAALKVDLSDSWSVTPTLQTQRQTANGQFAFTPNLGDLNIARYAPETYKDDWWQSSLTVEGRISDFDVIYAGGYMRRNIDSTGDYSDYSYFYDLSYANTSTPTSFGDNFRDNNGNLISPAQTTIGRDLFTKQSHELRIITPKDWRVHGVAGLFFQRQTNDTYFSYNVKNLAEQYSVSGLPGVIYLESLTRVDNDRAAFAEVSYDLTPKLSLTGGMRLFHYDNTVLGFFGYGGNPTYDGYIHQSGEVECPAGTVDPTNHIHPCVNVDKRATKSSSTHKLNVTYKFDDDRMVYGTWSTGYRPGGVNRVQTRPPYTPDYLTNFELGTKTTWFDHRLRLNGALFLERWKDAQFGITGLNGIGEIINAGQAEIRGIEGDVHFAATAGLTLSGSFTWLQTKLTSNACKYASPTHTCQEPSPSGNDNSILAPDGSRLPVSPKLKANVITRYEWAAGSFDANAQLAAVYQTDVLPALTVTDAQTLGTQPAYTTFDFSTGVKKDGWTAEIFIQNLLDKRGEAIRYASCAPSTCTLVNVLPIKPRLVGITLGRRF